MRTLRASCAHERDFGRMCAQAYKITRVCAACAQGAHIRVNFTMLALSGGHTFAGRENEISLYALYKY